MIDRKSMSSLRKNSVKKKRNSEVRTDQNPTLKPHVYKWAVMFIWNNNLSKIDKDTH